MGEASSSVSNSKVMFQSQGLPATITTSSKFFTSDNTLYLKIHEDRVVGLLKMGRKRLFIRDEVGQVKEIEPLCVLDFYVHESCQRSGHGLKLFEFMLKIEKYQPHFLGYDKPSIKLLSFLKKHFGLEYFVPQANNYVVFSNYWIDDKTYKCMVKDSVGGKKSFSALPVQR